MHLRRVGWLPHCLPTHRRRIRKLCLPSQENRDKDPVIGRVFVLSLFPTLNLRNSGLSSANQHTISGGQNNIIGGTDHAHGDNCGLAKAPKGTSYHASGVIGFAQRSHISAEYELPALLLNKNRILPSTYIDNGKSLL